MVTAQPQEQEPLYMSEAEYLAFEEKSEIKHEYVNGRVYAMAGAGVNHNIINGNLQTTLNNQLDDKPCVVVSSDMRLKVESKSVSFRYPDTMVICGEIELATARPDTVINPTVIVEVLSPSTVLKDHNEKLDEYIKIKSLQEYVIVSQYEAKVEVFTRQTSDKWLYAQFKGLDAHLELPSIDCHVSLSRIYRKVTLDEQDIDKPDQ